MQKKNRSLQSCVSALTDEAMWLMRPRKSFATPALCTSRRRGEQRHLDFSILFKGKNTLKGWEKGGGFSLCVTFFFTSQVPVTSDIVCVAVCVFMCVSGSWSGSWSPEKWTWRLWCRSVLGLWCCCSENILFCAGGRHMLSIIYFLLHYLPSFNLKIYPAHHSVINARPSGGSLPLGLD